MTAALPSARRRPIAVVAIALVETTVAWILAAPWAEAFGKTLSAHPDGDRALWWQPGMPELTDTVQRLGPVIGGLLSATCIGLGVYALASVYLVSVLMAALAPRDGVRRPLGEAVVRGAAVFGRSLGIAVAALVTIALVLGLLGGIPAWAIAKRVADPRRGAILAAVPIAISLLLALAVVAVSDASRARVVRDDASFLDAVSATLRDRRSVGVLVLLSVPRWLASVGLLGWGAWLSTRLWSVAAIFVVHQAIAFARVGVRASVLARALRVTSPQTP